MKTQMDLSDYDGAGRLVAEDDKTYKYGYLDKILEVQENGQQVAVFDYHVNGQIASATYADKVIDSADNYVCYGCRNPATITSRMSRHIMAEFWILDSRSDPQKVLRKPFIFLSDFDGK